MRVDRFTKTSFCSDDELEKAINDPFFVEAQPISESTYMVNKMKRIHEQRLPYACAFFVYQSAKKILLEFCLDFIDRYIPRDKYQALFSDTDCLSIAFAEETLDRCVKPELLQEYNEFGKPKFLVCDPSENRVCGKFKEEFGTTSGGFVGLCSKCYYAYDPEKSKISCKGLSQKTNHLFFEQYKEVLFGEERQGGTNYGIRRNHNTMFSYQQHRASLSAFYIKRYVNDDKITTVPLNL